MAVVEPRCPVRPGDMCSLCFPGATGPQDCGLVNLVKDDPELAAEWARLRREEAAERRARERQRAVDQAGGSTSARSKETGTSS